ncbi:MAG: NADPH-dependent FMN reductase [Puniceicoccaceae bacterium]
MRYLVISSSLSEKSRSRRLADLALRNLRTAGQPADWLDLREHPLPLCDGGAAYGNPGVAPVAARIRQADGILLASPIYNYDLNAAAKNLVEMTGADCWSGKVVGFLAAAGGAGSYLSVFPLANSLMADFRCVVIPRFVYAVGSSFDADGNLVDEALALRVARLSRDVVGFAEGLAGVER